MSLKENIDGEKPEWQGTIASAWLIDDSLRRTARSCCREAGRSVASLDPPEWSFFVGGILSMQ